MNTNTAIEITRESEGAPIRAVLVNSIAERMLCLPNIVGADCVLFEHSVYTMLRVLSPDYDGGFWQYFRLSNGGFFMTPQDKKIFRILCEGNNFTGAVSAEVAGLIACAMTYSYLSFRPKAHHFARQYEKLSAYIAQHPEAAIIGAALD